MDNINIPRSQLVTNLFFLFYASAKAALFPFLTMFFRQLGLSATQVGIIIGVKSVLAVMFASVWTSCATSCQKRRAVLMMSVFSSMVACLLLSVVPPANFAFAENFCLPIDNTSIAASVQNNSSQVLFETTTPKFLSVDNHTTVSQVKNQAHLSPSVTQRSTTSTRPFTTTFQSTHHSGGKTKKVSSTPTIITNPPIKSTEGITTRVPSTSKVRTTTTTTTYKPVKTTHKPFTTTHKPTTTHKTTTTRRPHLFTTTQYYDKVKTTVKAKALWDKLDEDEQALFKTMGITKERINSMSESDLKDYINSIIQKVKDQQKSETGRTSSSSSRRRRDLFSSSLHSLNNQLSQFQESIAASKNTAFILVLSIIIIGEVFSSCTEKLADKIWFDFLDGLDIIEKYGPHRAWYTLGFVIVPICVAAAVDHTPCLLPHKIHHFNIHFYTFAGLMGIALVWAFIYPMLDSNKKTARTTRVLKGMKILFADAHSFSYIFSVLLLGLLTASIDNFLFWEVQDLGGTELVIGGAITIAAVTEFFVIVLMKPFVKKITHVGAVVMALLLLSVRLVAYSFMWTSYIILPLAVFHAFTHTLMLGAVENYPDFKVNPFIMDRSARSVLNGIYMAVGYATGSVLSGFLYDLLELKTVYQGGAIMATVWCMLFGLIHKCSKHKTRVRYARLLQAEADQISDDDESVDDDWLEVALKHEK